MRIGRTLALLTLLLGTLPGPGAAQTCRPVLVAAAEFCNGGTAWESIVLHAELDSSGTRAARYFGQLDRRVWLLFSRIPEEQVNGLPWWRGPEDVMQMLTDFAASPYRPLGDEIARFYPLGEDVMAASIATQATTQPYVNIYTYYMLRKDSLVIQTGIQGATELTDAHKALHLEAVRAIRDASQ